MINKTKILAASILICFLLVPTVSASWIYGSNWNLGSNWSVTTTYNITVANGGHGSTNVSGTYSVVFGTNFALLATADSGYIFQYWVVSGTGTLYTNPLPLTMNTTLNGKSVTAYFSMLNYTISFTTNGYGSLNITSPLTIQSGTSFRVLATPTGGYSFANWTSTLGTFLSNPLPLTSNATVNGVTFTANFKQNTYPITLTITNPQATNYYPAPNTVPIQLSTSTNGTNVATQWNIQFSNATWLFGSNQTYTTTTAATISENSNMTVRFCARTLNSEGYSDYKELNFSILYLTTITLSLSITNPANTTYPSSPIPYSFAISGSGTNPVATWNVYFPNGTTLYATNQTGTSGNIAITWNTTAMLYCHVSNDELNVENQNVNFTVAIYEPTPTPSPSPTPVPTPTSITVIVGADTMYFRGDLQTSNTISAYRLDTENSDISTTTPPDTLTTTTMTYAFRVWIINYLGVATELTNGPTANITRTTSGVGLQTSTWNCPGSILDIGYDAIRISIYLETSTGWLSRATYISPSLINKAVQSTQWTFTVYTNKTSTESSFSFGSATYESKITGILFLDPSGYEITNYYLSSGNVVLAIFNSYTMVLGPVAYLLMFLIPVGTLYIRHKTSNVILFLFILLGGAPGSLAWIFIPAWAAAGVDIIILLIGSFLVCRVAR
jgi:hypothetical protein